MGIDAMEIGVYIRKGLIISIRTGWRSVRDYPLVWVMVFFFVLLYRFFPFVFGLLVSSSPVLVCTAVLLGTLLSFGDSNTRQVEKDENKTPEITSLKVEVAENDLVVQKDESFSVETHVGQRRDIEEKVVAEPMGLGSKVKKDVVFSTTQDDGLISRTVFVEEEPKEKLGEKQVIKEEREFLNLESVKIEFREEKQLIEGVTGAGKDIDDHSSEGPEKEAKSPKEEVEKSGGEFPNTQLENRFDSSQDLYWQHVKDHIDSSNSESGSAESSSPDASMADVVPMLDKFHLLLESEAPQPALISLGDSDAASGHSHRPEGRSSELEEEAENQGKEQDGVEEAAQGTQEDGTRGIVTWREEDQKNLMELGTSELERNQQLENLIVKQTAMKNLKIEAEKNLIDLDSDDPPFTVAPILTTRGNPFDLLDNSNETMGLPPMPGSAPSVFPSRPLPRQNPFDLPSEPLEEKPNFMAESFQQEFMTFQQKDMQFGSHESYSLGVSGELKQGKHNINCRPHLALEETEYPTLQMTETSDSKVSSVPETESVSSVAAQEDYKPIEQELPQESKLMSQVDHASDHGDCESQSSDEIDSLGVNSEEKRDVEVGKVDIKGVDDENAHDIELNLLDTVSEASPVGPGKSEVHVGEEQYNESSSSSLSKEDEKLFHVNIDEGSRNLGTKRDDCIEGSSISMEPSLTGSNSYDRSWVVDGVDDDGQTKEPVSNSSHPSKFEKSPSTMPAIQEALFYVDKGVITSTSTIASDMQVEISEVGSPHVPVERADGEQVLHDGSTREITSGNEGLWAASSHLCKIDEIESRLREVKEITEHDFIEVGFSGVIQCSNDPHVLLIPETVVEQVSTDSSSSSSETELGEGGMICEKVNLLFEQDQVLSTSFNPEVDVGVHQHDTNEKVDTVASSYSNGLSSEDFTSSALEKSLPSMEKFTVQPFSDGDHKELQESSILLVKSIEEANIIGNFNEVVVQQPEEKDSSSLSTLPAAHVSVPTEVSQDKFTADPIDINNGVFVGTQSEYKNPILENLNNSVEAIRPHFIEEKFCEDAEGIKDVDEGFLLELDNVGDFSVKGLGLSTNQIGQLGSEDPENLSQLPVFRDKPAEDIRDDSDLRRFEAIADSPNEYGVGPANVELNNRFPMVIESTSELQVTKDLSLGFKQLSEAEVEKPIVLESIHSEPLKETNVLCAEFELTNQDPNPIEIGSELQVPEARSLKDIDSAFKKLHGGVQKSIVTESFPDKPIGEEIEVGSTESGPSERGSNLTKTSSELPVLEARSLEDIDLAFKKLLQVQKPYITELLHDKTIRKETEFWSTDSELSDVDSNLTWANSELLVLEARSLKDIDLAFNQLHEGFTKPTIAASSDYKPMSEKSKVGSTESRVSLRDSNQSKTNSKLPVLEARSLEDIHLAFKKLHEGGDLENTNFPESSDNRPCKVESQDPVKIQSDLEVIEARSLEDIYLALQQLSKRNAEKLKPLESKHISAEVEVKETEPEKGIESSFEESGTQESSTSAEESNR